jgi:hypothetical protein
MRRMLPAPGTELLQLQPVRLGFAVLRRRIIPLFAITALHCNDLSGHKYSSYLLALKTCFLVWRGRPRPRSRQITSSRALYFLLRSFQRKSYVDDHGATPIAKTTRTPRIQNASRIHAALRLPLSAIRLLPTTNDAFRTTHDAFCY